MHAASYFSIAYRMMWYKVYYTAYFYAIALTSMSKDIASSFNYDKIIKVKTKEQLEFFKKEYIEKTLNKDEFDNQVIFSDLFFEATLFDINFEKADFMSDGKKFIYNKDTNTIKLPLNTINGISSDAIYIKKIIDNTDLKSVSFEDLLKIEIDGFTLEGKPTKKRITKMNAERLGIKEFYIKNNYKLTNQLSLF